MTVSLSLVRDGDTDKLNSVAGRILRPFAIDSYDIGM